MFHQACIESFVTVSERSANHQGKTTTAKPATLSILLAALLLQIAMGGDQDSIHLHCTENPKDMAGKATGSSDRNSLKVQRLSWMQVMEMRLLEK
jgi:hypothetical protein